MKINDTLMTRIEVAVFTIGLIVVALDLFYWRPL